MLWEMVGRENENDWKSRQTSKRHAHKNWDLPWYATVTY